MSRATRLRAVCSPTARATPNDSTRARAALADDDDDDARAIVLAWTRARCDARRATRRDARAAEARRRATRTRRRDAVAVLRGRERRGDASAKRACDGRARGAKGRAASAATGGGGEDEDGRRGDAATGVRRVDARRRRRRRRGASCEECVEVAKSAMWDEGNLALTSAALAAAAAAANARPNKPAPACVDFEFLWSVVEMWSRAGEGERWSGRRRRATRRCGRSCCTRCTLARFRI